MKRLATQFDPPGTQAVDAAIPGGCCCCCCCCCLATTISVSSVAGIQASRKAREATPPRTGATLWVVLGAGAMLISLIVAAGVGSAISNWAPSSGNLGVIVFGLGTVILWGTLLWTAFRRVGFGHPAARAAVFVLIGVIAFGIEGFLGAYIVLYFFPAYFLLAATVIGGVLWLATRRHVGPVVGDNPPPP